MAPKIQPKSEIISIIPQPRGNRAVKAIFLFIFVCLIILYFYGSNNYTSSQVVYGMAIHFIISQAWEFIVSLSEFSEEITHVHTRYNGEYLRAFKASFCMRNVYIFIFTSAFCYIFYDEDLLQRFSCVINLVMLFLCNLLCRLFGLQGPTPAAISEITEKRHLNVGHGLAWSYYVGYLKFVLPALKDSVKKFSKENNLLKSSDTCSLHILIPLSCRIYGDLKEIDGNIEFVKELPPLYIDRAGIKGRVFKNNVYRILDEDHRPYYCIVEYATPLASLYEMSDVTSAAFSKEDRIEQAKLFCRTLENILENSLQCRDAFRLVIYDDCPKGEDHSEHLLSQEILKHLKQQHFEEYDIGIRA
ncbi:stimulator of interferon genes protein isoform X1 [Aquarana catesbeiana]|uniref:stimulator of interferon genes protein isoform X1 n=1 Tax=Aquarana catesbeiana TaxID=8400 RepID=UPI003CC9CB20